MIKIITIPLHITRRTHVCTQNLVYLREAYTCAGTGCQTHLPAVRARRGAGAPLLLRTARIRLPDATLPTTSMTGCDLFSPYLAWRGLARFSLARNETATVSNPGPPPDRPHYYFNVLLIRLASHTHITGDLVARAASPARAPTSRAYGASSVPPPAPPPSRLQPRCGPTNATSSRRRTCP